MNGGAGRPSAGRGPLTTGRPIGFYVHHAGRGHLDRTRFVAEALGEQRVVVATSHPEAREALAGVSVTVLATDVASGPVGDVTAGGSFHWVPERPDVSVTRARQLLEWVDRHRPVLVVVDVSIEVAVFLRMLGIPVVLVRLHGSRDDVTHQFGYRLAEAFLAPYPTLLEDPSTPKSVRARTRYCGVIGQSVPPARPQWYIGGSVERRRRVLVLWGTGSPPPTGPNLDAVALATPGWDWSMIGPQTPVQTPTVVHHQGWVDDVTTAIADTDVVVGAPGDGTLGAVAAAGARLVAIPQVRPFDEQVRKAELLAIHRLAVVCPTWPRPDAWGAVLDEAMELDPARMALLEADGASARAATALVDLAREVGSRCA